MPKRSWLSQRLAGAFRAAPRLEAAAMRLADAWYQVALFPFRRRRIARPVPEDRALVRRTDLLNEAAERYFVESDEAYQLNKPYSDRANFPRHLRNAGTVIEALRLSPGDTVLDLGAGSCWLSHMLNLLGCRTVSVEVSATALGIGRQVFERDPRTNWSLDPRFEVYDGHRLPLTTGSVDRVVVNDAFHHVPNQRQILNEMYRVLTADGVVVMSEPGRGHSSAPTSVQEIERSGVLENELVLEDLVSLARSCGFITATVVVSGAGEMCEIDAENLGAFMGGKGFAAYWKTVCSALERHHYIVLSKVAGYTSRHPGRLHARITVGDEGRVHSVPANGAAALAIRVLNTGDTTWLRAPDRGWTRLGAHLYRNEGGSLKLLDYDWLRVELPVDVPPGALVDLAVDLPRIHKSGLYTVMFDMVVEGLLWFAERGSETASIAVSIAPPTPGSVSVNPEP